MATMLGWRVLRYTGEMLDADPARVVREVATLVLGMKKTNRSRSRQEDAQT